MCQFNECTLSILYKTTNIFDIYEPGHFPYFPYNTSFDDFQHDTCIVQHITRVFIQDYCNKLEQKDKVCRCKTKQTQTGFY